MRYPEESALEQKHQMIFATSVNVKWDVRI